jgi:hypothetical protein
MLDTTKHKHKQRMNFERTHIFEISRRFFVSFLSLSFTLIFLTIDCIFFCEQIFRMLFQTIVVRTNRPLSPHTLKGNILSISIKWGWRQRKRTLQRYLIDGWIDVWNDSCIHSFKISVIEKCSIVPIQFSLH